MLQSIALNKLALSPINVRKTKPDADIESLANDIQARGLKQNLVVIPSDDADQFEVIAGGRRLQALQLLAGRGDIDQDFAVPVLIDDVSQGEETSLAENIQRVAMHPADEYIAFAVIYDRTEGLHDDKVAHVARRFGKSLTAVEQRLRLGKLAPCILEALRQDDITLEQAMAFGTTEDQDRQMSAWTDRGFDQKIHGNWGQNAQDIRSFLTKGSIKGGDFIAAFIGRDAYEAAGGMIEYDLFAAKDSEIWLNGEIARELAYSKLKELAAAEQESGGWQEVRFVLDNYVSYTETERLCSFRPKPVAVYSKKQQKQVDALNDETRSIDSQLDEAGDYETENEYPNWNAPVDSDLRKLYDRQIAIQGELKALEEAASKKSMDASEHGRFIRFMMLKNDGTTELSDTWYSEAEVDHKGNVVDKKSVASSGKKNLVAEAGLSQSHADMLAGERRDVLAAALLDHTALAVDYAIFSLVDRYLASSGYAWGNEHSSLQIGRREDPYRYPTGKAPSSAAIDHLSEFQANLDWSWYGAPPVDGQFQKPVDAVEVRFKSFCTLDGDQKTAWLVWAVTSSMKASNAVDRIRPVHDVLASMMNINVADWWRPTADNYWSKLSGAIVEQQLRDAGALPADVKPKLKKAQMATDAERIFAGDEPTEKCFVTPEGITGWTPPAMRFL